MHTILDVGCRNGPRGSWLRPDVQIVGFDPDVEECKRLAEQFPPHKFLPLAVDAGVPRTFFNTEHPECGSFLRPRQDIIEPFGFTAHRITGTQEMKTVSLDYWCEANDTYPELLKLDTQGTELHILQAAEDVLFAVAAVITEVEFNPLYEDQPLFGDVDHFLRAQGFELRTLRDLNEIGGQLWWADAHYFRPSMRALAYDLDTLI